MGVAAALLIMMNAVTIAETVNVPSTVILGSLSQLYEEVEFDHEMHIDLTDDCADCHHHTTGTGSISRECGQCHSDSRGTDTVACRACHLEQPFSAQNIMEKEQNNDLFHIDKPGLKAVFHLNCLNCHEEEGGPTGCQDCHERNESGHAFYDSGPYTPAGKKPGSDH
jgi:hypothetical protein